MKILIIDDDEVRVPRIEDWAKRRFGMFDETIYSPRFDVALMNDVDVVFLDHDLGYTDVYNEIRKADLSNVQEGTFFVIHSMNPVGARNIGNVIRDHGFRGNIVPFSSM